MVKSYIVNFSRVVNSYTVNIGLSCKQYVGHHNSTSGVGGRVGDWWCGSVAVKVAMTVVMVKRGIDIY